MPGPGLPGISLGGDPLSIANNNKGTGHFPTEEVKRATATLARGKLKAGMYVLAVLLALIGLMFVLGAKGHVGRIVTGVVMLAAAATVVWLTRMKTPQPSTTIVQQIDLSGDVEVKQETMKCKACGAPLDEKSVELHEGAIFVKCPYCGTSYQLEEAPKW